jgi:hypothetical protein
MDDMKKFLRSVFKWFVILVVTLLICELVTGRYVTFKPSYYVGLTDVKGRSIEFPYGVIPFNEDGFPDEDFKSMQGAPRIGYFGDSVCFGVGAGSGYRVSDRMRKLFPQAAHMNFGVIGSAIGKDDIDRILKTSTRFGLNSAVYLMNLNDILPDSAIARDEGELKSTGRAVSEWLRSKSYLYSFVRFLIKFKIKVLYDSGPLPTSFELFPVASKEVIKATAQRIASLHFELEKNRIKLLVIILPYEMQISKDAAEAYRGYGVQWGEGFLERKTQRFLKDYLDQAHILSFDAFDAFSAEQAIPAGKYFVFTRGGNLDWNHPNREGHEKIASFLGPIVTAEGVHRNEP